MPGKRKRAFVVFTGTSALAALALAVAFLWPGLERRYHLERLRRDPSGFEEMLLSERAVKQEAAREFLLEPAGKQALFRLYIDEYDRCEPSLSTRDQLLQLRSDPANRGVLALWQNGVSCQTWRGSTGHASFSMSNMPLNTRRRALVLELIGLCAGKTFLLSGYERLEFQVKPVSGGNVEVSDWPALATQASGFPPGTPDVVPPMAHHACFFRVTSS